MRGTRDYLHGGAGLEGREHFGQVGVGTEGQSNIVQTKTHGSRCRHRSTKMIDRARGREIDDGPTTTTEHERVKEIDKEVPSPLTQWWSD
jgi:hypothetical protein